MAAEKKLLGLGCLEREEQGGALGSFAMCVGVHSFLTCPPSGSTA